jgi:thiol-disulfide isomerase/thioredoxin
MVINSKRGLRLQNSQERQQVLPYSGQIDSNKVMNRNVQSKFILAVLFCVIIICFHWPEVIAQTDKTRESNPDKIIVVTFFTSSDCPFCDTVKEFLEDLKTRFAIETIVHDINNPDDYDLFSKIEASRKDANLGVPLVIVGDEFMVGRSTIFQKIEDTIRVLKTSTTPVPLVKELEQHALRNVPSSRNGNTKIAVSAGSKKSADPTGQASKNSRKIKIIVDDPD